MIFPNNNRTKKEKGFATFYLTILILASSLVFTASIFNTTYREQRIIKNITKSNQAYFTAEAGVEDALLRLTKGMDWSSPYQFVIDDNRATSTISDIIGGSRTITVEGATAGVAKKVRATYGISADEVSFYYGAQIGGGGLVMDNNSKIDGNVFSNATAQGSGNTQITGTVWVASNGNEIRDLNIGGDAYAYNCVNSEVGGVLTYVSGGSVVGCTASGGIQQRADEISPRSLPISQSQVDDWKATAVGGGIIDGDYSLSGDSQASLGPKKITGKMTIDGNARLTITGPVWVVGEILIKNNARISLDPGVYSSFSGAIVGDGLITLQDNSISSGTGQAGSYLMYVSTAATNPAIVIKNNTIADIIFTLSGWIEIQNNAQLREVTGYGIHLKNNIEIEYEVGLADSSFSSGPGGSWEVTSWKEIE